MKTIAIYGTGSTGRHIYNLINKNNSVVAFLDSNTDKWGQQIDGISILGDANKASQLQCDEIIIASLNGKDTIYKLLIDAGVPAHKINSTYVSTIIEARIHFLYDYASVYKKEINSLPIAEGGVFQGDFAKELNTAFPSQKLYLFDTFEGFDAKDVKIEKDNHFSEDGAKHLSNTSIELVRNKLPHPENVLFKKGFFPETTFDIDENFFFFVNLDFDLYVPTLEGLRYFYPRLCKHGCLLVHDYFNEGFLGVKQAIEDFETESDIELCKFPIGDHCSIAIMKHN